MKMTQRLSAAVLAASALLFAAGAQAADTGPAFQIAQDNWPVNSPVNRSAPTTMTSAVPGLAGNTGSVAPLAVATTAPITTVPNTTTAPNSTPTQPNINITNTFPKTTPAAEPPRTQVEIRNQVPPAPVVNPPAAAPDINIQLPDVNVAAPPATNPPVTQKETVTRTDRFIYDDDDPNDVDPNRNNILYMAIFGILTVFLIAMIAIFYSRRRTTIIEDDVL